MRVDAPEQVLNRSKVNISDLETLRFPVTGDVEVVQAATILSPRQDEVKHNSNYENDSNDQRCCHRSFLSGSRIIAPG